METSTSSPVVANVRVASSKGQKINSPQNDTSNLCSTFGAKMRSRASAISPFKFVKSLTALDITS